MPGETFCLFLFSFLRFPKIVNNNSQFITVSCTHEFQVGSSLMSLRIAARGKLKLGKKDSNVVGPCKKMTKPRKKHVCSTSSPKFCLKNEYLVYLEIYKALNSSFYSSDDNDILY